MFYVSIARWDKRRVGRNVSIDRLFLKQINFHIARPTDINSFSDFIVVSRNTTLLWCSWALLWNWTARSNPSACLRKDKNKLAKLFFPDGDQPRSPFFLACRTFFKRLSYPSSITPTVTNSSRLNLSPDRNLNCSIPRSALESLARKCLLAL